MSEPKRYLPVVRNLPEDFEPYGKTERNGGDCSAGCTYFSPMQDAPNDWGVCTNDESHRAGLLTFEHQGCTKFSKESL